MFLIRRPSAGKIDRFLGQARNMSLSYDSPEMLARPPRGYALDEHVVAVGRGPETFNRARQVLSEWSHFDIGWIEVFPRRPSLEPGTVIAILVRHFGMWSLNGGRILACVEGTPDRPSFGFTYGTLEDHGESGEELFEVFVDAQTGVVKYRIRAASRPRALLTRLGRPVVGALQARFRRDSAAAMQRAVGDTSEAVTPASAASVAL